MKSKQLKLLPNVLIPYKKQIEQSYKQSYHISFFVDEPMRELSTQLLSPQHLKPNSELYSNIPKDRLGQPLYLLAQVDFAKTGLDYPFPKSGYLQFFVNHSFGLEASKKSEEEAFIRCIPTDDLTYQSDSYQLIVNESVLYQSIPFRGTKMLEPVSLFDYRFDHYFTNVDTIISEDEQTFFEVYMKHYLGAEHKIGGYPYFIDGDFRKKNSALQKYDTLLLQVVTDDSIHFEYRDSGIISFFINSEKLADNDFSDIYLHTEHY